MASLLARIPGQCQYNIFTLEEACQHRTREEVIAALAYVDGDYNEALLMLHTDGRLKLPIPMELREKRNGGGEEMWKLKKEVEELRAMVEELQEKERGRDRRDRERDVREREERERGEGEERGERGEKELRVSGMPPMLERAVMERMNSVKTIGGNGGVEMRGSVTIPSKTPWAPGAMERSSTVRIPPKTERVGSVTIPQKTDIRDMGRISSVRMPPKMDKGGMGRASTVRIPPKTERRGMSDNDWLIRKAKGMPRGFSGDGGMF